MNQADPLWKLDASAKQAQIAGAVAQAESANWLAQERRDEFLKRTGDVQRGVPRWLMATPDERATMETPAIESREYSALAQRVRANDESYEIRRENSQIAKKRADQIREWNSKFGMIDPKVQADILSEGNNGMILGADNQPLFPTQRAIGLLNANLPKEILPFGVTKSDVSPIALEDQRAKNRTALEETKQDNRLEAIKARQAVYHGKVGRLDADIELAKAQGRPPEVISAIEQEKAAAIKELSMYDEPEEITASNGQKFLRLGKVLRNLDDLTEKQKNDLKIVTTEITGLQKALMEYKDESSDEAQALKSKLQDAQLRRLSIFQRREKVTSKPVGQPASQSAGQSTASPAVSPPTLRFNATTGQLEPVQ